ncbi:hypothetical protein GcM3_014003 [Golovinomyces cichoracearum]|uniref:Uncharacterized protein n=1 Tax=Golovinomyces cichoracearum TaxID=62708 RepID=A0A420J997_9PEZI|nr:hypothetical protein GcM3_014003 [Golovinomyces cichoracearum]
MILPPITTDSPDQEAWRTPFNPSQADQQKEPIINGYITLMVINYERSKYTDVLLWKDFREDLEGWKLENFKTRKRMLLKNFVDHLVS